MPLNRVAFGDFIRGFVTRSMVDLNVDAATASLDGGEKRKPERTLNVYVVPPAVGAGIALATSGTMRDPSGAGLSGYVTKFAQVAYKICIAAPPSKSAGSSVSKSSFSVKRATPPAGGGGGSRSWRVADGYGRRHERRRVDARDGPVGAVRHPDGAGAGRDRRRSVSGADGSHSSCGIGVDSRDVPVGTDDPERPERR